MPLNKTPIDINFAKGLDTKTDPYQVAPGKFLSLVNTVFTKAGQLTKRDGFKQLTSLSVDTSVTAATFNGNLLAVGTTVQALSADTNQWFNKGLIQPLELAVVPQVRTNSTQLTVDDAIAANGLSCTVWYDSDTHSYYRITDSVSGEIITDTTQLAATVSATVGPKVFILGAYFIIAYWQTISASAHLQYLAIPTANPKATPIVGTLGTNGASITAAFDGYAVAGQTLYVAFNGTGTQINITALRTNLTTPGTVVVTSSNATSISVTVEPDNQIVFLTWYDSTIGTGAIKSLAYDQNLNLATNIGTLATSTGVLNKLTSSVHSGTTIKLSILYEVNNAYSYVSTSPATPAPTVPPAGLPGGQSDYVRAIVYDYNFATQVNSIVARGVGLASKSFYFTPTSNTYALMTYGGLMQPTYFLVDITGNVVCKLAYSNGAGYYPTTNLPGVSIYANTVQIGYLFKDLTTSVSKATNVTAGSQVAGIYNQTGINLASFTFQQNGMSTAELGGSLNLAGGFLWQYDGVKPVEQGFHLYPEDLGTGTGTTTGFMDPSTYFYVATYEWTDAQGLIHRSAPSVPIKQVVPAGTSTNFVAIAVPTLRLTYKIAPNPVRIVIYRWSLANQIYYQVTPITSPVTNDPTVDSIQFIDDLNDSSIIGNTILYTTGGVVENIAAPALTSITPYGTRLFAIDAEDQNLLWFSKQVIQNTPVEMTDLFTVFAAPTISATGSTGPMKCLAPLDDKLIIFKSDAIYYLTGVGPDNTGANNDFSIPIFVTSTVGCANQASIVFMPNGLMFQSDKGIWLLGRDLSTTYIGFPVEAFNSSTVVSANNIPGTNQVRFRLDNGTTLMYDYFFNEWGTFDGISATTSTIYQNLETVITAPRTVIPPTLPPYVVSPQVYQETPGLYLDGSSPVLMSFQTGWMSMAGIQGYERFYQLLLLGNYLSPFKLNVQFAYDFLSSVTQSTIVSPTTPGPIFGLAAGPFGTGSPFGGNPTPFKARVFPNKQKCETFQLTVNELYDPSLGTAAGAGLTLSGMQMLAGVKKGSRTTSAARSFG